MRTYGLVVAGVAGVFLVAFLLTAAFGLVIEDPVPLIAGAGALAAVASVSLLAVDVIAPIPASVVMVANGWLFGLWWGSLVSFLGGMAAFAIAFGLGRAHSRVLTDVVGEDAKRRSDALVRRHGALAVALSRPVPIASETLAIMAGASRMTWARACAAAATGVVPQALVYAVIGATSSSLAAGVIAFLAVLALSIGAWMIAPRVSDRMQSRRTISA